MGDFETALTMGERWRADTFQLIEDLGSTSFMRDTAAVLATVQRHPNGMPRRDLLRKHGRLRKRDTDEILHTLEAREQIEMVRVEPDPPRRGPRPVYVYPFGRAPEASDA